MQKWIFIFNKLWSKMFNDNKKKHCDSQCEHDFERPIPPNITLPQLLALKLKFYVIKQT